MGIYFEIVFLNDVAVLPVSFQPVVYLTNEINKSPSEIEGTLSPYQGTRERFVIVCANGNNG